MRSHRVASITSKYEHSSLVGKRQRVRKWRAKARDRGAVFWERRHIRKAKIGRVGALPADGAAGFGRSGRSGAGGRGAMVAPPGPCGILNDPIHEAHGSSHFILAKLLRLGGMEKQCPGTE